MTKNAATSDRPWLVLIGPAGAGKSTVGQLIADRSGRLFVDLDDIAETYYQEVGWGIARLRERIAAVGRVAAEREWEQARVHAVTRVVGDFPGAVISLGAGHTSYADPDNLRTLRVALNSCRNVVHLLPSESREVSLALLRERCIQNKARTWIVDEHDFLAQWLDDTGVRLVATCTIYTETETVERTAERIMNTV